MKLDRSCLVLAIVFLAMITRNGGAQPAANKPAPFAPGETLDYDVSWSVFPAGKLTATLSKDKEGPGDSYVITTTANSQGFVSLLYNVQDQFKSVFNPQTLCSVEISKKINEGRHHRLTKITFDRHRGMAILDEQYLGGGNKPPKHDEHEIPPCVQDIITAFYYVRSQPLHVGKKIKLAINDGSKTKIVVASVTGRKKIQTPMGIHEAFRVEPSVFGNLYEKKKGKLVIWFSDDEYHFPLRIRATMKLGAITGTLTSVTPTPPGYAPPGKHPEKAKPAQSASAVK
ncbi:MAG: DUF3108 domain-containing protein [Acidobacteria bacterium]|nr:DUF3108 domain-containing protein [Acidobacteriota bacterium]